MTLFRRLVLLVAALTCLPATALAAEVKTFAVAPFTVHGPEKYQYLSQGVQSMLESRMNWPGHLAPMDKAKAGAKLAKAPTSEAEAKKTAAELPPEIKNKVSHRGQAVAKLKDWLLKKAAR